MAAEAAEEEESLIQELQVLESIYPGELQISQGERVVLGITLHPATGHDEETQYVRITLELSLPPKYPAEVPEISVKNPRGLCDEQINSIVSSLRIIAEQGVGCPILYEMIEKGKEMLTASNIPRGHCVICLYDFKEGDSLTKTPCFHHFHSYCLGRYAEHSTEQKRSEELSILCPVCREDVTCDVGKLQAAPPPLHPEETYTPDRATLKKQKELRQIYQVQLAKGGIIDIEAEKNRFFISIQEPPPQFDTVLEPQPDDDVQSLQPGVEPPPPPVEPKPPSSRGHPDRQRQGYRNQHYRPVHTDHNANSHMYHGRGRKPHGRGRPERYDLSGDGKPAISRGHEVPGRGNYRGRNFRSGAMVQLPPRGRGEQYLKSNPL
ncbi:ring finger protein 25 L homeolog [Xenopus laevis]|uniref:LOC100049761 protein n=1 Tax=Xenopus laevis TaxID=8355 RepID=A5D8N9_XENLA|nr:ring finger protein 25 L homeolog [Xenopus laevis]AAI41754.1 LOC100049761 protein [Xenopus laevis]